MPRRNAETDPSGRQLRLISAITRVACAIVIGCAGLAGCSRSDEKAAAPKPQEERTAPESGASHERFEPRAVPMEEFPRTAERSERGRLDGERIGYRTIRVFYGTNRRATGEVAAARVYGGEPGPLTLGFCDVSIPETHVRGELESPKLWKFEIRENPQKHVVLLKVQPASGTEFFSELQRTVWESIEYQQSPDGTTVIGGDAFVFVHGFNNTFEDAARRAGQIAHDLRFRGAPILYSWPSGGEAGLQGYHNDARQIAESEEHFRAFLASVVRESGARKIHLVAHSMGNRLVSETLRSLSNQMRAAELRRLNQIVLTAPDIDAEYFRVAIAPRLVQTAERITIYSSSKDLALKASSWANRLGPQRLGEAGEKLVVFPQFPTIEVVDASLVDTSLFALGHSYHADNPSVLDDMELVFQGVPAELRNLQRGRDQIGWQLRARLSSATSPGPGIVR